MMFKVDAMHQKGLGQSAGGVWWQRAERTGFWVTTALPGPARGRVGRLAVVVAAALQLKPC